MTDFRYAGSISTNTLRFQDLIPTFLAVLKDLCEVNGAPVRSEYDEIVGKWDVENLDYSLQDGSNDVAFLLDELCEALEECAPDGYCFGAHSGDGADFGFWEVK